MSHLKIPNWDDFQHYSKRNPPWIKLHNTLLADYEFNRMQDASKAHIMLLWLLASQCDNKIPNDINWIQNKLSASKKPDIKLFIDLGFLELVDECKQSASNTQATCHSQTETETETETETHCVKANGKDFERFWESWPVKRNKDKARQAFKAKKFTPEDVETLIKDVEYRKEHDTTWARGYIPHCSTYLNGKRWEDSYDGS